MLKIACLLLATFLAIACKTSTNDMTGDKDMSHRPAIRNEMGLPIEGTMPPLSGATGWINSKPISSDELRGKVVLIDIWTYTCINWLRTEPYVRAWAEKYKDKGLVVIGVHSPEFDFERHIENVRSAARDLNVDYAIALDSDHNIWDAFENQYWPAFYFVDARGNVRHHQFGEGDYETSERVIQKLLVEAGNTDIPTDIVSVDGIGIEAAADWKSLRTPENYLGYQRTLNFSSPGGAVRNEDHEYELPAELNLNHWALAGAWTVEMSAVVLNKAAGRIAYCFHARDLHLVMSTRIPGQPVRFRISIDGKPPGEAHGLDVDADGNGVVTEPRLYQLVRQLGSISDRQFEIEFFDPGVEVHAFTFG
jgi:thiol-disulfide isomerase/thioredoxin